MLAAALQICGNAVQQFERPGIAGLAKQVECLSMHMPGRPVNSICGFGNLVRVREQAGIDFGSFAGTFLFQGEPGQSGFYAYFGSF